MVGAALSRLIKFLETFTEHNNVIYNENYLNQLMYFIIYMYIYIVYNYGNEISKTELICFR